MTFFELASLLASAATIFGLIVGVFSVWNGRMTRREIGTLIAHEEQATRDLIATESRATRELMEGHQQATQQILSKLEGHQQATQQILSKLEGHQQATQQILSRLADILGRIDDRVR